jgi:hypothetical protein
MAVKLTRLTHKIATQLHLVAESYTICSSRSRVPVRKLSDTPSYLFNLYKPVRSFSHNSRCVYKRLSLFALLSRLLVIVMPLLNVQSRHSSVGIVTGYGLNDGILWFRFPAEGGGCVGIFLLTTVSRPALGPTPASHPIGTGGFFLGGKAAMLWSWTLTSI